MHVTITDEYGYKHLFNTKITQVHVTKPGITVKAEDGSTRDIRILDEQHKAEAFDHLEAYCIARFRTGIDSELRTKNEPDLVERINQEMNRLIDEFGAAGVGKCHACCGSGAKDKPSVPPPPPPSPINNTD